ncbi:MAG TPA: PAS domain S-box protein [Opitutaceae bacterium]|nr:PAS domain S-box protein [Opitutaceae bacterium]
MPVSPKSKRRGFSRSSGTVPGRRAAALHTLVRRLRAELEKSRGREAGLRESARRHREVFARASDAILIFEPAGETILEANLQALKLYGFRRRELIGRSLMDLSVHPALGRRRVAEVLRKGRVPTFETVQRRKDGTPLFLAVTAAAIDYDGRRAVLSINRDVTQTRRAEQLLRESEQRLRAAREASLDAFYVLECVRNARGRVVDFCYVDFNRRGAELVSRRREELIGRRLGILFPLAKTNGFMDRLRRVVATGRPLVETFRTSLPEIQAAWLHQQAVKLGDGVAITSRDITELKRAEEALRGSEQRLRAAREASLDALVVFESVRNARGRITDFRCVDANQRALDLAGLSRDELTGSLWCERFPAMRRSGAFARHVKVVATGRPLEEEYPVGGLGMGETWVHHQVVKVGDGFASVTRDITDRKQGEVVLKALPRRIIEAQESERRHVARELHDSVSQVLASVRYRLHALKPGLPEANRQQAAMVEAMVDRALGEVRRISHGLRPSELDDLGLAAALRALIVDFNARTKTTARLHGSAAVPRLPANVKEAIYRIVQEALTNVERHARARRVVLRVTMAGRHVRVSVRDDGRGFSPATKGLARGSGLGLRHMRERAELAGGSLTLEARRGGGTEIIARIPLSAGGAVLP